MSLIDQTSQPRDVPQLSSPPQQQPPPQQQQQQQQPPSALGSTPYQTSQPSATSINNIINPPVDDQTIKGQPGLGQAQFDGQSNEAASNAPSGMGSAQPSKPVPRVTKGKYQLHDFSIQRTLGTGSFGRVHLVQSRHNQRFYAVKVLKKGQVVKMKQVEHTNDERRMLGLVKHPFLITLWGTFQDSRNLYMVMDFVEGGELFSLLRKSQVRCKTALSLFIHFVRS